MPQVGPHASQELIHAERLGYVVVGAGIERFHFYAILSAHRQNDDGNFRDLPDAAAQTDAVQIGHGQVGDNEMRTSSLS